MAYQDSEYMFLFSFALLNSCTVIDINMSSIICLCCTAGTICQKYPYLIDIS